MRSWNHCSREWLIFLIMIIGLSLSPLASIWATEDEDLSLITEYVSIHASQVDSAEDAQLACISLSSSSTAAASKAADQGGRESLMRPSGAKIPASLTTAQMSTLFRSLGMYSVTPGAASLLPDGMDLFSTLPPSIQGGARTLAVFDEEGLGEHFKYLNEALQVKHAKSGISHYNVTPERLRHQLFTVGTLRTLDMFCKYQIEVKHMTADQVAKRIRVLFASLANIMVVPMESKAKTVAALQHFWVRAGEATNDKDTYAIFKDLDGIWYDQTITVIQNFARYKGSAAIKTLLPHGGQAPREKELMKSFPVTYVMLKVSTVKELKEWWLLNYMEGLKGLNWVPSLEKSVKRRARVLGAVNLQSAIKFRLQERWDGVAVDFDYAANLVIHSLYRQRYFLYKLTRAFYPGETVNRPEDISAQDVHNTTALHAVEGSASSADKCVQYLIREFEEMAKKDRKVAADAFLSLLEAPMTIFNLKDTLEHVKSAGGDVSYVFKWLAGLPGKVQESQFSLYYEYIKARWSIVHCFADMKSARGTAQTFNPAMGLILSSTLKGMADVPGNDEITGRYHQVMSALGTNPECCSSKVSPVSGAVTRWMSAGELDIQLMGLTDALSQKMKIK